MGRPAASLARIRHGVINGRWGSFSSRASGNLTAWTYGLPGAWGAAWAAFSGAASAAHRVAPFRHRCRNRVVNSSAPDKRNKKRPRRQKSVRRQRFTEKIYEPYALAIGQVALAWNDLHEELAFLFVHLSGGGPTMVQSLAAWNSLKADRQKREMLVKVLASRGERDAKQLPGLAADAKWLLDRANSLEEARNNAIHSPLLLVLGSPIAFMERIADERPIIPLTILGNPRAKKLALLDLLQEFRRCRNWTLCLRDFAAQLNAALSIEDSPWPCRPKQPDRKARKGRPSRPRTPIPLRGPPRSSSA